MRAIRSKLTALLRKDVAIIRILIVTGIVCLISFTIVLFQPENKGYSWLFGLLCISVGYKLLRLLHEWYHYWKVVPPVPPVSTREWTVDVLTTFCPGEPYEMIEKTLRAIQAIRYPHTAYLCDEANDPYLRQLCEKLGVKHVTRIEKKNAKAGNINNALQQATGEICVVLDPDHIPVPDFLDHVLPYFENPEIGFVQCVQAYYNRKESLVAYGAAEQTYSFYGPMMTCMSHYGTTQAIGANCTFRRAALDSIGGHAAGLSEDMHTAMQLHAKNWKSVYVPKPLSYGLVPGTLAAYYKQQLKWARGTFELLFTTYIQLFSRFTWRQKIHYFTIPLYYLIGVIQLIDLLIPIFSLILMRLPLRLDLNLFAIAYLPLLFIAFLIRQYAQRWLIERHEAGFHIVGGILSSGTWFVYLLGLIYTLLRVNVPYLPTPKNDQPRNNVLLCLPNIVLAACTLGAIGYSVYYYEYLSIGNSYIQMMIGFGVLNTLILGLNVLIGQEKLLFSIKQKIQKSTFRRSESWGRWLGIWRTQYRFYGWLRQSALPLYVSCFLLTTGLVSYTFRKSLLKTPGDVRYATTQPFYFGQKTIDFQADLLPAGLRSTLVPQHLGWLPGEELPRPMWSINPRELPLLYLEPRLTAAPADKTVQGFLEGILRGKSDSQLNRFAQQVAQYKRPVLVAFAPYFDDEDLPWAAHTGSTLFEYQQAFQYLATYFRNRQINNVVWVWCPAKPNTVVFYYPGSQCVDWIGLQIKDNPAKADDGESHSFPALYQPLRNAIMRHKAYSIQQKPILITSMHSSASPNYQDWERQALMVIQERYREVKGVLLEE